MPVKMVEMEDVTEMMFRIFRDICIKKVNRAKSKSELAEMLGRKSTDVTFNNSINFLIDIGIIDKKPTFQARYELIINRGALGKFVRKHSPEFDAWETFIHSTLIMAVTR